MAALQDELVELRMLLNSSDHKANEQGDAHMSIHQLKDTCGQLNIELAVKSERLQELETECNMLKQNVIGHHEEAAIDYYQPIVQQYADKVLELEAQLAVRSNIGMQSTDPGIVRHSFPAGDGAPTGLSAPDIGDGALDLDFMPRGVAAHDEGTVNEIS